MRLLALAFAILLSASLGGCDGEECWLCWGGQPNQGQLALGLTAVQTDQINQLQLSVSGVAFLNEANEWRRFEFDPPRQINLFPQQNQSPGQDPLQQEIAWLLEQERLDGGRYRAVQLVVNDYPESSESFVDVGGAVYRLDFPRALILNSAFDMPRHGPLELAIDFDLHRGLAEPDSSTTPPEALELTPYMRLVDIEKSGSISGRVAARHMQHQFCLPNSAGFYSGFVYVFTGRNLKPADALASGNFPLASIPVTNAIDADSLFQANFLPEGDYTLALVCEGEDYRPYASTNIEILATASRSVRAGRTTENVDFR